jgi:tetratricopeptide (TPR) repeat protein
VFWVDVSNPDIARTGFIAVARMFGAEVDSVEDACGLLANRKKPWLLILDNADDPGFDYQIYIPSGTQGNIIVTSRFAGCKHFSTVGWETLTNLEREECQELLLKAAHIPKEHWKAHTDAAESVVCLLESHTLALIQAGAYVAKGHCKLSDYPKIFHRQRRRLLEFRPTQARSRYCDIYTTFEASAEVLSDDALQLLGTISVLHFSFLPVSVFESAWVGSQQAVHVASESEDGLGDLPSWDVSQLPGFTDASDNETGFDVLNDWHVSQLPAFIGTENNQWDSYRLSEAIYLLESLSLITTAEQDGVSGISMHPLAHAWAKDRQKPEAKKHSWVVAGSVIALSVRGSTMRMRLERHLQPHVQSYVDERTISNILCGFQRNTLALVWSSSWMLMRLREDSRLERLLHELFREAGLDPARPQCSLVPLYHLLAQSHYLSGHWKMAVNLMEQVVEIRRETLDETHRNRLASQHVLAMAFRENGQTKEAVKLLEHVVKIRKATQAETHPSRLASQHELASAYQNNGQIEEAVKLLEYVVKIKATTLAETHPDQLVSKHNLAVAYQDTGRIEEAIKLLEYVVKFRETTLAETHPSRLASQHNLAGAYKDNGQIEEAVKLLEHVVKIEATTLAETHPSRLTSQHNLAGAYKENGQIEEAVKLLEHVVKIRETTLAETHPDRLASQHNLASAYEDNGQIKEAVKLLEHVVKIKVTTLAETHPSLLTSQHNLASAYEDNGQIEKAVKLLEHVVKIRATTLAETHPNRLASQHNLAGAYKDNGQIKEAVKLLEHVVKIKATTLAEAHPSRLVSQHNLASAYEENGQIKEAVKLLEHVVKIEATTLAETHPDRLISQQALARALDLLPTHPLRTSTEPGRDAENHW